MADPLWVWLALLVLWLCICGLALAVLQLYKERALNRLDPDGSARARLRERGVL